MSRYKVLPEKTSSFSRRVFWDEGMADEVCNVLGDSKHGINKIDLLRSDGSTAEPLKKLNCAYSDLDLDALVSNLLSMERCV